MNRQLVEAYPHAIEESDQRLADAQMGVANRQITGRRDWFFALYPADQLKQLQAGFGAISASEQSRKRKTASSDVRGT